MNSANWPPRTDVCLPLADETGASTTDIVRAHAVVSEVLQAAGAEVSRLSGCCGLAGNFGVEKGHYDVSVAVAEQQLLPIASWFSPGRRTPRRTPQATVQPGACPDRR